MRPHWHVCVLRSRLLGKIGFLGIEARLHYSDLSALFSRRKLTFTFAICYRQSVCLSVVCLSATFVHLTRAIEIFGNVFTPLDTLASDEMHGKFYGDRPRGTPPSRELNTKGVAEYSDFGPIERYISETVQDIAKLVLITNRKSHMGSENVGQKI